VAVWAGGLAALKDAGRAPIRAEHVYPEERSEDVAAPRKVIKGVGAMRRGP